MSEVRAMRERLAALDIGTNTVLCLVAGRGPDGALSEGYESCATTRLGAGLDAAGVLSEAAMARTLDAAESMLARAAAEAGSGLGIAAATSAVREAGNGQEFLGRFAARFGAPPLLLSGAEEAATVYVGAASDQGGGSLVSIDIGGGSTELAAGHDGTCFQAHSVTCGCVRLSERFGLGEIPAPGAVAAARAAVAAALRPVLGAFLTGMSSAAPPFRVVVSGGTATTYAALRLALGAYDRGAIHGYSGSLEELESALADLLTRTSAERSRLPGVSASRAPVLPAGLLILAQVLSLLGASAFTVTTRGLRFGLASRLAAGDLAPTWRW